MRLSISLILAIALSSVFSYPHQDSSLRSKRLQRRTYGKDQTHSSTPNGAQVSEHKPDTHSRKGADLPDYGQPSSSNKEDEAHNDGSMSNEHNDEDKDGHKDEKEPCANSTDVASTPGGNSSTAFGEHPAGQNPFGDHPYGNNPGGQIPSTTSTGGYPMGTGDSGDFTSTTSGPYSNLTSTGGESSTDTSSSSNSNSSFQSGGYSGSSSQTEGQPGGEGHAGGEGTSSSTSGAPGNSSTENSSLNSDQSGDYSGSSSSTSETPVSSSTEDTNPLPSQSGGYSESSLSTSATPGNSSDEDQGMGSSNNTSGGFQGEDENVGLAEQRALLVPPVTRRIALQPANQEWRPAMDQVIRVQHLPAVEIRPAETKQLGLGNRIWNPWIYKGCLTQLAQILGLPQTVGTKLQAKLQAKQRTKPQAKPQAKQRTKQLGPGNRAIQLVQILGLPQTVGTKQRAKQQDKQQDKQQYKQPTKQLDLGNLARSPLISVVQEELPIKVIVALIPDSAQLENRQRAAQIQIQLAVGAKPLTKQLGMGKQAQAPLTQKEAPMMELLLLDHPPCNVRNLETFPTYTTSDYFASTGGSTGRIPYPTGGLYGNETLPGDDRTTTTTGAAGGPSPMSDAGDGASLFGEDMTGNGTDVAEY
ncbi:MAG: hypothetical protein L6R38_002983 [Xanthoria sp. 2 TBL-2021]|nr:MAG: hypothetical protein L6R38_002983 [Xanthoria sp. 2 TBL-2021]